MTLQQAAGSFIHRYSFAFGSSDTFCYHRTRGNQQEGDNQDGVDITPHSGDELGED